MVEEYRKVILFCYYSDASVHSQTFLFYNCKTSGQANIPYYNDILTDRMKSISVLIPMHNEEQVLPTFWILCHE